MVYEKLLERYAEELGVVEGVPIAPYADLTEKLRLPDVGTIDWYESHLVDLDEGNDAEEEPIDWDDIVMSIGAEVVLGVRLKIKSELNYTWYTSRSTFLSHTDRLSQFCRVSSKQDARKVRQCLQKAYATNHCSKPCSGAVLRVYEVPKDTQPRGQTW